MKTSPLHTMLATTRAKFALGPAAGALGPPAALACIGNGAGDLDSIVSSVCLAYCLAVRYTQPLVLPVLPFARADFRLR